LDFKSDWSPYSENLDLNDENMDLELDLLSKVLYCTSVMLPLDKNYLHVYTTTIPSNAELVFGSHNVVARCWISYFLKVICYSYKLLHEKRNLLQLLVTFFQKKFATVTVTF